MTETPDVCTNYCTWVKECLASGAEKRTAEIMSMLDEDLKRCKQERTVNDVVIHEYIESLKDHIEQEGSE